MVTARDKAAAAGRDAVFVATMGGLYPLAKRTGAWPSDAAVTAVPVAADQMVTLTGERHPEALHDVTLACGERSWSLSSHRFPTTSGSAVPPHINPTDKMALSGIRRHGC